MSSAKMELDEKAFPPSLVKQIARTMEGKSAPYTPGLAKAKQLRAADPKLYGVPGAKKGSLFYVAGGWAAAKKAAGVKPSAVKKTSEQRAASKAVNTNRVSSVIAEANSIRNKNPQVYGKGVKGGWNAAVKVAWDNWTTKNPDVTGQRAKAQAARARAKAARKNETIQQRFVRLAQKKVRALQKLAKGETVYLKKKGPNGKIIKVPMTAPGFLPGK